MMKRVLMVAALGLATPALAQTTEAPQAEAQASETAAYGLDTPVEKLAEKEETRTILEQVLPGLLDHPMYGSFKALSLREIAPLSGGQLTDEHLAKAETALKQVKAEQ